MSFHNVANNATSFLAQLVSPSDLTITVVSDTFPPVPFYLTLISTASPTLNEILEVTLKTGNVFTVVRSQDGTTAKSFLANDKCQLFLVAGLLTEIQQQITSHSTEITSQLITVVRDMTLTGIQTITGLTSIPKSVSIRIGINNSTDLLFSTGSWHSNGNVQSCTGIYKNTTGYCTSTSSTAIGYVATSVSDFQTATFGNLLNGQFDLTWAKTGLPTGTVTLFIECFYH